nr:hypothetical protein [Paraburkholderia sp. Ac-20336]
MKTEWHVLRERIKAVAHLLELEEVRNAAAGGEGVDARQWVIVYRTAQGFCCMYRSKPVEFDEMLDVQIWSEEEDVRTWFIGL